MIAERFRFTLMTMLHTRIAYPKHGHEDRYVRGTMSCART